MATGRTGYLRLVLIWCVSVFCLFAAAECAVRMLSFPTGPNEGLAYNVWTGLPSLNACMEKDPCRFWRLKAEVRNQRVKGIVTGLYPLDFTVSTDETGMRKVPAASCAPEAFRILAAGDSCTFGFGVDDEDAWPAQLQRLLDVRGEACCRVVNAGVPGYSSFQSLQYFREIRARVKPDLVILQSWVNDANVWGQGDYATAAQMQAGITRRLLMKSRLYDFVASMTAALRQPDRPRLLPEEVTRALSDFAGLCTQEGIPLVFLVWPDEKSWKTNALAPYAAAFDRFAAEHAIPRVNLLPAMAGKPGPFYVDPCHGTKQGNAMAASALAPVVRELLSKRVASAL